MSDQFNWFTEEETDWEAVEALPVSAPARPFPRRWWWLTAIALALVAVGGLIFQQIDQRVEIATANTTADIESSFALLLQAVENDDADLFTTLISGSDAGWTAVQEQLLAEGLFFDRQPMGLTAAASPELVSIIPAPDLRSAEVVVEQQFTGQDVEPINLQQTLVYRLGRTRWLLSPPRSEFWGDWQMGNGRYLTLAYRQRDETIAQRLLTDLDDQLAAACRDLADLDCPDDLNLAIRLSSDLAGLTKLDDPQTWFDVRFGLILPSPSLIGVPIDEAGYQALRKAYAVPVVSAAIGQAVGWECCQRGLFFQALVDWQLAELDLQPWPLNPDAYADMFTHPILSLRRLGTSWDDPPDLGLEGANWPQVYSVVAYMLDGNPGLSAAAMQQRLVTADSYNGWARRYLDSLFGTSSHRQWLRTVQSQLAKPTTPLPRQDVQLMCRPGADRFASLYRLDVAAGEVMIEAAERSFLFMSAIGQGDGVLVQERQARLDRSEVILWRNGRAAATFSQPLNTGLFRTETVGSNLLLYSYDFSQRTTSFLRLDMETCQTGECAVERLSGVPVWSPSGQQTLLSGQGGVVFLGDEMAQSLEPAVVGTSPFWLDETTIGFVKPDPANVLSLSQIMTADVADKQPVLWLDLAELATAVSPKINITERFIKAVTTSPINPDLVFVAVGSSEGAESEKSYLFSIDRSTDEIALLIESEFAFGGYSPFDFSPDGRWLMLRTYAPDSALWRLHMVDSQTGRQQTLTSDFPRAFPGYDWSVDSQWLLRAGDGFVHFLNPANNDQALFVHDFGSCSFAAWVN